MNPVIQSRIMKPVGIPRVSGDEPVFPLFPLLTNLYSPRERG